MRRKVCHKCLRGQRTLRCETKRLLTIRATHIVSSACFIGCIIVLVRSYRHQTGVRQWQDEKLKPVRGIFERPKGSGLWWINFYQDGKQHREKVGARSAAIDLYRIRKADARRGIKLPDLRNGKVTLSALIDGALEFARTHNKSVRDYECKARILREAMGTRIASEITPQDIDRWLSKRCKTPATVNRYRAVPESHLPRSHPKRQSGGQPRPAGAAAERGNWPLAIPEPRGVRQAPCHHCPAVPRALG